MLALDYDVSRAKQDEYGLLSHNRASAAQQSGKFATEILPISTSVLSDPKNPDSSRNDIVADKDDGIRHGQTLEKMQAGKPAFKDYGDARSTGANSSQVTDGAAMVVMMPRWKAEELGLEILAKHVTTSVVGVSPRVMGIGPVYAIPSVQTRRLERFRLADGYLTLFCLQESAGASRDQAGRRGSLRGKSTLAHCLC